MGSHTNTLNRPTAVLFLVY